MATSSRRCRSSPRRSWRLRCALLVLLWPFPALRIRLVPRRLRYRHAHDNALKQFLARNVHITAARTGVLIFVSLAERYAEIVADAGINSRSRRTIWDGVVADLIAHAQAGPAGRRFRRGGRDCRRLARASISRSGRRRQRTRRPPGRDLIESMRQDGRQDCCAATPHARCLTLGLDAARYG